MNATQLAAQFDMTARHLETQGHLVIVRRARQYLNDGRADLASSFLLEATRRMPGTDIRVLSDGFQSWRRNAGDLDVLLQQPEWSQSEERENELANTLVEKTRDLGSRVLLDSLLGKAPQPEVAEISASAPPELDTVDIDWIEDEPTSEVFEAPSRVYERPHQSATASTDPSPLPAPLVVGVIVMLQVLTIYFCFFRPS
jgi:hypothetical protein